MSTCDKALRVEIISKTIILQRLMLLEHQSFAYDKKTAAALRLLASAMTKADELIGNRPIQQFTLLELNTIVEKSFDTAKQDLDFIIHDLELK